MMVRKQVYITREQNEALKQKAQELGVTEAELIRRGIEGLSARAQRKTEYRAGRRSTSVGAREVATMAYDAEQANSAIGAGDLSVFSRALEEDVWQSELAFMRSLGAGRRNEQHQEPWRFDREEVYEERLSQILRRH
jgi:hypothetical protein